MSPIRQAIVVETIPTTVSCLVSGLRKTTPITKTKQRTHKFSINWTFFYYPFLWRDFFVSYFLFCVMCVFRKKKWQDTKLELRKILLQKIPLVFIRQFIVLRNDASLFPDKDHLVIQLCHFDRNGWQKKNINLPLNWLFYILKKNC